MYKPTRPLQSATNLHKSRKWLALHIKQNKKHAKANQGRMAHLFAITFSEHLWCTKIKKP